MKQKIHPKMNKNIKIKCTCGATYVLSSTAEEIPAIDTCMKCHAAWTKQFEAASTRGDRMARFKEQIKKREMKQKEMNIKNNDKKSKTSKK